MKKIISTIILSTTILASQSLLADDDWFESIFGSKKTGVAPVTNSLYSEECGSCHFAYQPGLLPARSWRKLMEGLEDHFGENAELMDDERKILTDYLAANAADTSDHKRSVKIMRSLDDVDVPLRITKVPYIIRKHNEISPRMLKHDKVKSLANCDACHTTADTGSFSEGKVKIPGIGRWED